MFSLGFVLCNPCQCYFYRDDCLKNKGSKLICMCCRVQVRTSPRSKNNMILVRN